MYEQVQGHTRNVRPAVRTEREVLSTDIASWRAEVLRVTANAIQMDHPGPNAKRAGVAYSAFGTRAAEGASQA